MKKHFTPVFPNRLFPNRFPIHCNPLLLGMVSHIAFRRSRLNFKKPGQGGKDHYGNDERIAPGRGAHFARNCPPERRGSRVSGVHLSNLERRKNRLGRGGRSIPASAINSAAFSLLIFQENFVPEQFSGLPGFPIERYSIRIL